jgi:hypothetical protein
MALRRVVERNAPADEALAMVNEQPRSEFGALRLRRRQGVRALARRRPRDRDRVEAVGPPAPASAAPRVGRQLRRHAQDPLAARDHKPPQRARDVPAVLQRPHPFAAEPARPHDKRGEARGADLDRPLARHFAARGRDRGDRVRALVGVRTEHDH